MTTDLKLIGDRIRKVRYAYKLTQQQMAAQLHVTRSCLANYERGTRQPPIEFLRYLAKEFQVDLDYLLGNSCSPLKEHLITELFSSTRYISKDGRIDVSMLTPTHKIFAVEFVNYLRITERKEKSKL